MDMFETVKQITKAHAAAQGVELQEVKYRAVHMGARDWAWESPLFDTREQAQAWLDDQLRGSHRRDDWGYVNEVTVEPKQQP